MRLRIILAVGIMLTACKKDKTENPMEQFRGEPYTGSVSVRIVAPDGWKLNKSGESSLHFTDSSENILKMVLFGALSNNNGAAGDAGFILPVTQNSQGWHFRNNSIEFIVEPSGDVTGKFLSSFESTTYQGSLSKTTFTLEARSEMLQDTEGGLPKGTVFTYNYKLRRKDDSNPASSGTDPDRPCNRVVWQVRNVYNPGGAMTMISVPVCFD